MAQAQAQTKAHHLHAYQLISLDAPSALVLIRQFNGRYAFSYHMGCWIIQVREMGTGLLAPEHYG